MQIVFCFPFPSTPNWHCKIEEEKLSPFLSATPPHSLGGDSARATKERRRRIQSFFFSSDSSFLSHHKRRASELEVGGRASRAASPRKHAHRQAKKRVRSCFPLPYSFVSPHQADKLLRKGGGWLCGVGRKEDDGRRRRRRKSKNRTG